MLKWVFCEASAKLLLPLEKFLCCLQMCHPLMAQGLWLLMDGLAGNIRPQQITYTHALNNITAQRNNSLFCCGESSFLHEGVQRLMLGETSFSFFVCFLKKLYLCRV